MLCLLPLHIEPCRPASRRHNSIVARCPRDFPIVAFRISKVGGSPLEELGINWLLRYTSATLAHHLCQVINIVTALNHDADREANPSLAVFWLRAAIRRQFV